VSSGGWSAGSAGVWVVLRFLERGWCSEMSDWVRERRPFGRVLDCDESSEARRFLVESLEAVDSGCDSDCVRWGVSEPLTAMLLLALLLLLLWSREPVDSRREAESGESRERLAGRSSSPSECAWSKCARSLSELRRLVVLASDGVPESKGFDAVFAARRVVMWRASEG
jgi:hypothetical protein